MGRAADQKLEGASSNPVRVNEFFVGGSSVRMKTKLVLLCYCDTFTLNLLQWLRDFKMFGKLDLTLKI